MPYFKRKKGKRPAKGKRSSTTENANAVPEAGKLQSMQPGPRTQQESILHVLQNSYMYTESGSCFRYSDIQLVNSLSLHKEYQAFRLEKRKMGYTEEELKESFGFLLFEHGEKTKQLCEQGLLPGNGSCSTLGDPSKGVYVSKYSDCLDLSPWYNGKSGYIAILRLTKGRVKAVMENYTQNFTAPSPGYDCHVSEQISAVSSTTSSFLAYERTQYYLYEQCEQGECLTARPRHALPFAIVAFSYGETKPCASVVEEKSTEKTVFHYHPWRGQLKIQSLVYHVTLRSNTGPLMPTQLPAVLTVDRAMRVSDLKALLPLGIFETCFTSEVSMEGRFFSLFEVVALAAEDTGLPRLTGELKEKELALILQLKDFGLLVIIHSSYFLTYEGRLSEMTETLLAMFVFPDSRVVQKETKLLRSKSSLSPDVLQVLPGLNYAETEADKCPPGQQGTLCELLEQRLQSYATLIHPGMPDSPSREASGIPDQYDMPEMLNHLYSTPRCQEVTVRRLQAYLRQPETYTLPVARAVELLAVGQEERGDDADDDVYYCLSSPEEFQSAPIDLCSDGAGVEEEAAQGERSEGVTSQLEEGENEIALPIDLSQPTVPEDHVTPGTAVLTCAKPPAEVMVSPTTPMSGDLPTDHVPAIAGDKGVLGEASQPTPENITECVSERLVVGTVVTESTDQASELPFEKGHLSLKLVIKPTPSKRRGGRRRRRRKKVTYTVAQKALVSDVAQSTVIETAVQQPQPLKRKGFGYGLKTIVTDCGRVFIPHGSEILPKDIASLTKTRRGRRRKHAEETEVEPEGVPSQSVEKMDVQVPSMDTADQRVLPMDTADLQAPPTETSEQQAPPTEASEQQAPPTEASEQQAPPIDTAVQQAPPIETDIEALLMKTAALQVPRTEAHSKHVQPIEKADRPETGEFTAATADTVPSSPPEHHQIKDSETEKPPDKISSEETQGSRALISVKELRTIVQKINRRKLKCPDGRTLAMYVADLANGEPQKKKSKSDGGAENEQGRVDDGSGCAFSATAENTKNTNLLGLDPTKSEKTQRTDRREGTRLRKNSPRRTDLKSSLVSNELIQLLKNQTLPSDMVEQGKLKPFKKRPRSRITESKKENRLLNSDTPASHDSETVGQSQSQGLRPKGHRVGPDGASLVSELGSAGAGQRADALTLLADLALSASGDEASQKRGPAPESNIPARGRRRTAKCKLPLRSPPPQGLVVKGEIILTISKEHSYSLPPSSMLLGLTGGPQQLSAQSVVETCSPSGQQEPLEHIDKDGVTPVCQEKRGREEMTNWLPNVPSPHPVTGRHKRGFSSGRRIVQEGKTIRVTRRWKEKYEFNLDSKYTNDPLDKSVLRALHGPWDFRIEETFEQTHLILHMWIGLFYSRSTTRFFQTDPNGPVLEGRPPSEGARGEPRLKGAMPVGSPGPEVHRHPSETQGCATLTSPTAPPPPPPLEQEVLDLREESKKAAEPILLCPKVLDLSQKHSEVLDLRVPSKHTREACPPNSTQTEPGKTQLSPVHKPTPRHYNYSSIHQLYLHSEFNYQDHRASVDIISDELSEEGDDSNKSWLEDDSDNGCSPACPDTDKVLRNEPLYTQLCEHTARVCIGKDKVLNGTHKAAALVKDGNIVCSAYSYLRLINQGSGNCRRRQRTSYIQPCSFTNNGHRATGELQPVANTDHDSIKGTLGTVVPDENNFCKGKDRTASHDFSKDEEHAIQCDGFEARKAEDHTAVNEGNYLTKDVEGTSVHFGNNIGEDYTAAHNQNDCGAGKEHVGAVHDGIDCIDGKECTTVHDGKGFSKDEDEAVHEGLQCNDSSKGEEPIAVLDGNDFNKDEHKAEHDWKDSVGEKHTAVCNGNDFTKDENELVHDANEFIADEELIAEDNENDYSEDKKHTAVHDGNAFTKDEHESVHDGKEFIADQLMAEDDGNDFSEDNEHTAVQHDNDYSKNELVAERDGNYFSKNVKSCTEVHDQIPEENTAVPAECKEVHDGKNFGEDEENTTVPGDDGEHTAEPEGNDFSRDKEYIVGHDEKDFSKDEECTAGHDGKDFNKDEEDTAVPDGTDEPTELHDGKDVIKDEQRTVVSDLNETHDRSSASQEETPLSILGESDLVNMSGNQTPLCEKNDSSRICDSENSTFQNRSPTPTLDELPYDQNISPSGSLSGTNTAVSDPSILNGVESTSRSPTPTQDEIPCSQDPYTYASFSLAKSLPPSPVELAGSNKTAPAADSLQGDNETCPGSIPSLTLGAKHTVDKAYSCSGPTSDRFSQSDRKPYPSCKDEPSSKSITDSDVVAACLVTKSLSGEVLRSHSSDELCPNLTETPGDESITWSKEISLSRELPCPDSLSSNKKANSPSKSTADFQSSPLSQYQLCPSSSLVSMADDQCKPIVLSSADSLSSHPEPTCSSSKAMAAEDALYSGPKSAPSGSSSISSDVNACLKNVPPQGPEVYGDHQQNLYRRCSDHSDNSAEELPYSGNEMIPNGNYRVWTLDSDPCRLVTGSPSKNYSSDDSSHSPHKPCADGKERPRETVTFSRSRPSSLRKYSPMVHSPPGSGSDSAYDSLQSSIRREHEPVGSAGPTANLLLGHRNYRSRSSYVSTGSPPDDGCGWLRTHSKCPVIAVKPCKNEYQGGSDMSLALEGGKTKSPIATESSSDPGAKCTTKGHFKKWLARGEDVDEEEYSGQVDRVSVNSGSPSGDGRGEEDAAGSPVEGHVGTLDSNQMWGRRETHEMLGHRPAELCTEFVYHCQDEYDEQEMDDEVLDYSKAGSFSFGIDQSQVVGRSWPSCSVHRVGSRAEEMDWLSYCRSGRKEHTSLDRVHIKQEEDEGPSVRPSSIITVLDHKGNRKTYENYPITKTLTNEHTRTVQNTSKGNSHLYSFLQKWEELHHAKPDLTQSSLDLEYLIFSEKMNQILKKNQRKVDSSGSTRYPWRKHSTTDNENSPCGSPMVVQFSELEDYVSEDPCGTPMSLSKRRIKVDMPEGVRQRTSEASTSLCPSSSEMPLRLKRLSFSNSIAESCPTVSNITVECARSYHAMMNDVCSGKKPLHRRDKFKRERNLQPHNNDFCKQIKEDMYGSLQNNLNAVVRQSFKAKFRFYIMVTSTDAFFEQTKELLEAEGHVSVGPDQFDLEGGGSPTPLLIIIRNEDIADHISTIPHLLELKKAPSVLFAGVDRPDDVLNLTHQELFSRGGFVVCDAAALDSLSLDNIKRLVGFLEELSEKGRWKWLLHYKDSRQLRENARRSSEARDLKNFVDSCQEAGLVEVMPYHECDVISRERPDYLRCLLRLQVQHATARFPIFITDAPEDSFGKCGILAMNISTFLRISRTDTCTIL